MITSSERKADPTLLQGNPHWWKRQKLKYTEQPDHKIVKSNPDSPLPLETDPTVAQMIIMVFGHFITRCQIVAGRIAEFCKIRFIHFIHYSAKSTIKAFVVQRTELWGINTAC